MPQNKQRKEWVLENFADLADGQRREYTEPGCPCYRGTKGQCRIGVRRDGGKLYYNCFKPTCTLQGGICTLSPVAQLRAKSTTATIAAGSAGANRPQLAPLEDTVPYISGAGRQWLTERVGLLDGEIIANRFRQLASTGQVYVPVYNLDGLLEWYQLRRYYDDEGYGPKWLSPKDYPSPIYIPRPVGNGEYGVITEDALSSIVCNRVAPSIALLGTALSELKLARVLAWARRASTTRLIVVLDADAYDKALKVAKGLRPYFDRVHVLRHSGVDPKYWPKEKLERLIDVARQTNKSIIDEGQLSEV